MGQSLKQRKWAAAAIGKVLGGGPEIPERLQKKLTLEMENSLFDGEIKKLVAKRLVRFGVVATAAELDRTFAVAKKCSPEVAWALIATSCNGWMTDRRAQEAIIGPCLFACGGEDSLDHYLVCDKLWQSMAVVAPPRLCCPKERCGILHSSCSSHAGEMRLRRVAAVVHGYRTIRLSENPPADDTARIAILTAAAWKFDVQRSGPFGAGSAPLSRGRHSLQLRRAS